MVTDRCRTVNGIVRSIAHSIRKQSSAATDSARSWNKSCTK
uniref:Uncharacterized protein n=1 Tax=Arundo donax TaxID=35708 RepID=A0A0A9GPA2_ARUDO